MNRQQRRKLGIKSLEPIINIRRSDIEKVKQEAVEEGCKKAFFMMLHIPAMIIQDKFPKIIPKKNRVQTFIDLCLEQYDAYNKEYVSIEDLQQCLEEESGIKIQDLKKQGGF